MKKLLCMLLALALCLSLLPASFAENIKLADEPEEITVTDGALDVSSAVNGDETVASGQCGDALTWTLDENGTLTVSGTGAMWENLSWKESEYYDSIRSVVILDGVTSISKSAFYLCQGVTSVTIPDSVTEMGAWAFYYCPALESVRIPNYLRSLPQEAFRGCISLTSVTIPAGVLSLGNSVFSECGLTEIYFRGRAPGIGDDAFRGVIATAYYPQDDSSWTEYVRQSYGGRITWETYVPEATVIDGGRCGDDLSWTMDDLKTLTISGTGGMWDFDADTKPMPWAAYQYELNKAVIEEGVTGIGAAAFEWCLQMTRIKLPDSLARIGEGAFSYSGLREIKLPEGLTTIEAKTFFGCGMLASVKLPESLTSIGKLAFHSAYLSGITIPAGVTSIGEEAFSDCFNLGRIYFEGAAPVFGYACFAGVSAIAYYPADDPSWTEDVMQDYGGTITWTPAGETPDLDGLTEDHTNGKATLRYEETLPGGEIVFSVASEGDLPVLVVLMTKDGWTVLPCTTDENGVHFFTAALTDDAELALIFRGDANQDTKVNMRDSLAIKKHTAGTQPLGGLPFLAANVNGDAQGSVNMLDSLAIKKDAAGTERIAW